MRPGAKTINGSALKRSRNDVSTSSINIFSIASNEINIDNKNDYTNGSTSLSQIFARFDFYKDNIFYDLNCFSCFYLFYRD